MEAPCLDCRQWREDEWNKGGEKSVMCVCLGACVCVCVCVRVCVREREVGGRIKEKRVKDGQARKVSAGGRNDGLRVRV